MSKRKFVKYSRLNPSHLAFKDFCKLGDMRAKLKRGEINEADIPQEYPYAPFLIPIHQD